MPDKITARRLLDELLRALDRGNPDEAESILDRPASKLPADRMAAVRQLLDEFDFRGAEATVPQ